MKMSEHCETKHHTKNKHSIYGNCETIVVQADWKCCKLMQVDNVSLAPQRRIKVEYCGKSSKTDTEILMDTLTFVQVYMIHAPGFHLLILGSLTHFQSICPQHMWHWCL